MERRFWFRKEWILFALFLFLPVLTACGVDDIPRESHSITLLSARQNMDKEQWEQWAIDAADASLRDVFGIGMEKQLKGLVTRAEASASLIFLLQRFEKEDIFKLENSTLEIVGKNEKEAARFAENAGIMLGISEEDVELRSQENASREEAFCMARRTFQIEAPSEPKGGLKRFSDTEDLSEWAREEVEKLALNDLVEGYEGKMYPRENITFEDFRLLLQRVAKFVVEREVELLPPPTPVPTSLSSGEISSTGASSSTVSQPITPDFSPAPFPNPKEELWEKFINPLITIICLFLAVSGFSFAWIWSVRKKRRRRKVFLAGAERSGKSTLKKLMENRYIPETKKREYIHTEILDERKFKLEISSDEKLTIEIHDPSGSDVGAALHYFNHHWRLGKAKAFILLLAHTKEEVSVSQPDEKYIEDQKRVLKEIWLPILKEYKKEVSKIIIFINKMDLLPEDCQPVQTKVFKEHIDMLWKEFGNKVGVIEGSTQYENTLDKLIQAIWHKGAKPLRSMKKPRQ